MSEKIWSDDAWADYLYWQSQDKKTLKRINMLIQDIERNGAMKGIGDPEALKGNLQGEYSRRINEKDRLVYHLEDGRIYCLVPRTLQRQITTWRRKTRRSNAFLLQPYRSKAAP